MMKLLEKWPWDKQLLRLYILTPLVFSSLLLYLFPTIVYSSLLSLLFLASGFGLYFRYSIIHKNINTLLNCKSAQNGEAIDARLFFETRSSPGIAILRDSIIILIPITGRRRKIHLSQLATVYIADNPKHKRFISKTAITMETVKSAQYTFIIPTSTAKRWLQKLYHATEQPV